MFGGVWKPARLLLVLDGRVVSAHCESNQGTLGSSHLLKMDESSTTFGQAALSDLTILSALTPQGSKHLLLRLTLLLFTHEGDTEYRRRKKSHVVWLREGWRLQVEEGVG